MPDTVSNIVYQFAQQLKSIFGTYLSQVILYGAYARGDYQENSDVDDTFTSNWLVGDIRRCYIISG